MPRLLVGLGDPGEITAARIYLLDLVEGLLGLGVDLQVAFFGAGNTGHALFKIAEVRSFADVDPLAGLTRRQRRLLERQPELAEGFFDPNAAADLAWVRPPDGIHLHGVQAARLLRVVRDASIPVTTFVHPDDPGIDTLSPGDRALLIARTDRFLLGERPAPPKDDDEDDDEDLDGEGDELDDADAADAGPSLADRLVAAGVDRARIEPAPPWPLQFPAVPVRGAATRSAREAVGLPTDAVVVAIPGVDDWFEMPDVIPTLAWELERIAGPAAPTLLWYGVPEHHDQRWTLDYEMERMGLRTLRPVEALPDDVDLVDVADLVLVPLRTTVSLPEALVETAAIRRVPVACWDGDPIAEEVRRWGGIVVERADARAMATELAAVTKDHESVRQVGERAWRIQIAEIERLLPIEIPAP